MQSAVKTTLLGGEEWRDELVIGEALCKEKQVFYVTETATVTETLFLKILDNTKLSTHTSKKLSARRTDRYLHNTLQTKQTNIHDISGIRTCDCRNQVAVSYLLECMTTGIGRYIFM